MYTTIIHPLRVHLHLSLSEYCVLDSIYHLQNKKKYDFWCIASHGTIAENIGLSKDTVQRAYSSLIQRGYLVEGGVYNGKTKKVRVSERECDLFNHHKQVKGFLFEDEGAVKLPQNAVGESDRPQVAIGTDRKLPSDRPQVAVQYIYNTNSDTNNELLTKVSNCETSSHGSYGKKEINDMLSSLKKGIGCGDFRESAKQQRIWGRNLVALKNKIGVDDFKARLVEIVADDFRRRNAGSLQYLYKEIKSFIS